MANVQSPMVSGQPSAVNGHRAVFLDRDGVINQMVYHADFGLVDSPANPEEFTLLPGAPQAIAQINRLGFPVVVVSNQPGIAKGRFSVRLLEAMTEKMLAGVMAAGGAIERIYYCLHHPHATLPQYRTACDCRKPKPGLLLQAAQELGIDLTRSVIVGDGVTDVLAGQAVGARTIFISARKCYMCDELAERGAGPDFLAANLTEAVEIVRLLEDGEHSAVARYGLPCSRLETYSPVASVP